MGDGHLRNPLKQRIYYASKVFLLVITLAALSLILEGTVCTLNEYENSRHIADYLHVVSGKRFEKYKIMNNEYISFKNNKRYG